MSEKTNKKTLSENANWIDAEFQFNINKKNQRFSPDEELEETPEEGGDKTSITREELDESGD